MNYSNVIKKPYITEKTNAEVAISNKYTFIVDGTASKTLVKDAIEKMFSVKVINVNMLPKSVKTKRSWVGKRLKFSTSSRVKKAVVQLAEKNSIAMFTGGSK